MGKKSPAVPAHTQFTIDFSFGTKSSGEIVLDGQTGVLVEGYATKFNEIDAEGERVDPQALSNAATTFFDNTNGPLPILYHHGFDKVLGTKRIGRVVDWRLDRVGLWVKAFLPRPPALGDAVTTRAREVYANILGGTINGFSIGGVFGKVGRAIKSVALYEISATPNPCLDQATFALASKSLPALLQPIDPDTTVTSGTPETLLAELHAFIQGAKRASAASEIAESIETKAAPCDCTCPGCTMGRKDKDDDDDDGDPQYGLSRPGHSAAMAVAQKEKSLLLHDHLVNPDNYPTHAQGSHDPQSCPQCAWRRDMQGIKAAVSRDPWDGVIAARLPRSCFLDQGTKDNKTTWRYPIFTGAGAIDGEGCYSARGALSVPALDAAYAVAKKDGDSDALHKIAHLRDIFGLDSHEKKATGKKVKPLSIGEAPHTLLSLATLATEISQLSSTLSAAADGPATEAASLDGKAGRSLSQLNASTARTLAHAVIDAGQGILAWIDKNTPAATSGTKDD